MEPNTLTVREAHELLGTGNISRASIYNAIRRGEFPHLHIGPRRVLIIRSSFLTWLAGKDQRETKAAEGGKAA